MTDQPPDNGTVFDFAEHSEDREIARDQVRAFNRLLEVEHGELQAVAERLATWFSDRGLLSPEGADVLAMTLGLQFRVGATDVLTRVIVAGLEAPDD